MKYNIHEKKVRVNYFRFPSWDEDYNKYVCTQPCTCIQTHVNFVFLNCITFNMPTLCGCACAFSPIWLFATLWTVARQAPLSMGFSRQNYWSGLPFPSPGDLPDPGIKTGSPALPGGFLTIWVTRKDCDLEYRVFNAVSVYRMAFSCIPREVRVSHFGILL